MTQYNTLNIKLSNSQLNKQKSAIKNGTKITLDFSSNVFRDSKNEENFPHKLLSTNKQVSKLLKAFANNSSTNKKLSKTQLHKTVKSGGLLGRPLGPLLKTRLPLVGNILKPLAKSILIQSVLTAAASGTNAAIHRKMFESAFTTLIISNEEMNDIMKIVKSLEESGLLIKGVSKTNKNQVEEYKGEFIEMLLGTLGASLLGNVLTSKGTIRAGKGTIRAGENF